MTELVRSLDQITTTYCVFEKDQVLTHLQLNQLVEYLDDQGRLTRVGLLGVGVVCGLVVTLAKDKVTLTRGVGVTSDGDLMQVQADTTFNAFKTYDQSNVVYPLFRVGGQLIKAFELVREGDTDAAAAPLTRFNTNTTLALDKMTAVLLVESYVKDRDICSGTDCDNLGKDSISNMKLLLIERASADSLKEKIATPADAYSKLNEVTVDRPLLSPAIASPAALAAAYRTSCNAVHTNLVRELKNVFSAGAASLVDVFPADPTAGWNDKLNAINVSFAGSDAGIQYYYDFLKDLVQTYNDFHNLLFGERTVCCPDVTAFPKHLLLGNLDAAATPENRTGLYPSPLASRCSERLVHARFLARKLDVLIKAFQIPGADAQVRITPSRTEETPLEDRAIPFYYQVNPENPVASVWNYQRTQRGMEAFNYGYNAAAYGGQGGAANPLMTDIGCFSFFRIEGHLGKNVQSAAASLTAEINKRNLPLSVQSVLLGADKTKITNKPPIRYTDLHRFQYLLRQDGVQQLDDAANFSSNLRTQVKTAVDTQGVDDTSAASPRPDLKQVAEDKHNAVVAPIQRATAKLNRNFTEFRKDATWKDDVRATLAAAGDFKLSLTKVTKTDFVTPFDSLIASTNMRWVDMLDGMLKSKEDKEDDKLLFSTFLTKNPGAEHFAGAGRGQTFVLLYDDAGTVVSDCTLPYYWRETAEEEPAETPLPKPDLRPPLILNNGVRVDQPLEKFVRTRLDEFQIKIEPDWQKKLDGLKEYVGGIKDSTEVFSKVLSTAGGGVVKLPGGVRDGAVVEDRKLNQLVENIDNSRRKVEKLQAEGLDASLDDGARAAKDVEIKKAEDELANAITETTKHIAVNNIDVSAGSDGLTAISEVSRGTAVLKDTDAVTKVTKGLNDAAATNVSVKKIVGRIIR